MKKQVTFKILGKRGDFDGAYEVDIAREKFGELTASGMKPLATIDGESQFLDGFREDVDEIKWLWPVVGG